jgi:hypothetical protein
VSAYPIGKETRSVHDPGQRFLAVPQRGVAEGRSVAHDMGVPAEHLAVEGDGALVVAGVQLEPARRAGLVDDPEALVAAGLPDADCGATRVADDAMVPRSATSMALTRTWPPWAAVASTAFLASSVAKYTDHTSGKPEPAGSR